jgi:hypothetical protein
MLSNSFLNLGRRFESSLGQYKNLAKSTFLGRAARFFILSNSSLPQMERHLKIMLHLGWETFFLFGIANISAY